jgi:hypothetical protein
VIRSWGNATENGISCDVGFGVCEIANLSLGDRRIRKIMVILLSSDAGLKTATNISKLSLPPELSLKMKRNRRNADINDSIVEDLGIASPFYASYQICF